MLVTFTRPLTITTANGRPATIAAGATAEARFAGYTTTAEGAMYQLSGEFGVRFLPGFEPAVRVDQLHRAAAHAEPLYRFCRKCHFTGQITHWRNGRSMDLLPEPKPCVACSGTGHAKAYPANI